MNMKLNKVLLFLLIVVLGGCLEVDRFDGLTDSRPKIAIEFPGRQYDQDVGLGFIVTGFATNPDLVVTMKLDGGPSGVTIEALTRVEARGAKLPTPGACTNYATVQTDVAANNERTFEYRIPLSTMNASAARCNATIVLPNMYYEFIFTLRLSDDQIPHKYACESSD